MKTSSLSCFLFIAIAAFAAGCADEGAGEDVDARSDDVTVQPCAGACGIDAVRGASFARLSPALTKNVIGRLDHALATQGSATVRFARPKTAESIAALGLRPRSVEGASAVVDLTLRDLLVASRDRDVLSFTAAPAAPPTPFLPTVLPDDAPRADAVIGGAELAKLDAALGFSLRQAVNDVLGATFQALVALTAPLSEAALEGPGVDVIRFISSGKVAVADLSVAGALRLAGRADVTLVEEDSPLDPFPATPEFGGSHVAEPGVLEEPQPL